MKRNLFLLIMVLCLTGSAWGQAAYRVEPTDVNIYANNLDYVSGGNLSDMNFGKPTSDGGFIISTVVTAPALGIYARVPLVTKISPSGQVDWSRIFYDPQHTISYIGFHDMVEVPGDGYFLMGDYKENNASNSPVSGAGIVSFLDQDGIQQWGGLIHGDIQANEYAALRCGVLTNNNDIIANGVKARNSLSYSYSVRFNMSSGSPYIQSIEDGGTLSGTGYYDMDNNADGECISVSPGGNSYRLTLKDSDCKSIIWETMTALTGAAGASPIGRVSVAYDDVSGGYFIGGSLLNGNAFVSYADPSGITQWVEQVAGIAANTVVSDVYAFDGKAYIVGSYYWTFSPTTTAIGYMAEFDQSGLLNWADELDHTGTVNERVLISNIEKYSAPGNQGQISNFFVSGHSLDNTSGTKYTDLAAYITENGTSDDECGVTATTIFSAPITFLTSITTYTQVSSNDFVAFELDWADVENFDYNNCGNLKKSYSRPAPQTPAFACFPNPSSGTIHLEIPQPELPAQVSILDLQGRTLFSRTLNSEFSDLDLGQLSAGMYQLSLQGSEQNFSQKLILTH